MFERFTDRARQVMALATEEARRLNHEYIGTEHILMGLVKEGSGVAANVLRDLNVNLNGLREDVEKLVSPGQARDRSSNLPQTPRAKKAIEYAIEEARALRHEYVGTEHLLLGLLRDREGVAARVLTILALDTDDGRRMVVDMLGGGDTPPRSGRRTSVSHAIRNDDEPWFTTQAMELTRQAAAVARRLNHDTVVPDHVALVLLGGVSGSQLAAAIEATGADPKCVVEELTRRLRGGTNDG